MKKELYEHLEYYEYNPKLKKDIRYFSMINYEHFNKVFKKKLELDNNLKIKFVKIESLKNRYWSKKERGLIK